MLPSLSRRLDPIGMDLLRPLLRQLDDVFNVVDAAPRDLGERGRQDFSPGYELDETDEHFLVSIDVPGIARDDLSIELTGDRLVISGERRRNQRRESFQRVFTVPDGVNAEGVVAECRDGVLRLAIRKPQTVQTTKIKIGDGSGRTGGFLKNLVGKKDKDPVEPKGEPVAMAN